MERKKEARLTTMNIVNSCETSLSPQVILELEPGAAEQPDSRGKNYLHTAIIKVDNFFFDQFSSSVSFPYYRVTWKVYCS